MTTNRKPYVKITARGVYGKTLYDPACENSKKFAKIAGTKTLTIENLKTIRDLGFSIIKARPKDEEIFDSKQGS